MVVVARWATVTLIAAVILAPSLLRAQAVPRAISGIVRDTLRRPLESAVISLDPTGASRATRADANGRFRFDRVSPGRHQIRTTWLGYEPDERTVEVRAEGLEVTIVLQPLPFRLDTLRIEVKRTGILGTVVVHSDFRALGGADVQVIGTSTKARTPADGRFVFPGVRPGGYVVLARRDGFKTRLLPVAVRHDGSVELVLALDSIATKADRIVEGRWFDLRQRTNRRNVTTSAVVPRQELAARGNQSLDIALRYSPSFLVKGLVIDNDECIYVDGVPVTGLEARDFRAGDVAMVEIYGARSPTLTGEATCAATDGGHYSVRPGIGIGQTRPRPNPAIVRRIYIWLKH